MGGEEGGMVGTSGVVIICNGMNNQERTTKIDDYKLRAYQKNEQYLHGKSLNMQIADGDKEIL